MALATLKTGLEKIDVQKLFMVLFLVLLSVLVIESLF